MAVVVVVASLALSAAGVVATTSSPAAMPLRRLFEQRDRYLGATVDGLMLADRAVTAGVYTTIAGTEFGALVARHELAWDATEPSRGSFNFERGDPIVEYAGRHHQTIHAANLVSDQNLPVWVTDGTAPPDALRDMLREHVTGVVAHFRGRIARWNVVSRPLDDDGTLRATVFGQALGDGYLAEALRAARAADPAAKLYLSDRGIEGADPKSQAMYDLARSLKARGVPLDGVDLQGDFASGQVPQRLRSSLQRFADLGLDVALSQVAVRIRYPVDVTRLAQQAADYTTITQACLQVSRCVGLSVAGVYDRESDVPYEYPGFGSPLLFDSVFGKKPAYDGVAAAFS